MKNKLTVVMDPGIKNWGWVIFKNSKPIKMGYAITSKIFLPREFWTIIFFMSEMASILGCCDVLIIERYIGRQAARGMSVEKINLMIGKVIALATLFNMKVILTTANSWKRKLPYKLASNYANKLGFLRKDNHIVDCLLMFSVYVLSPKKLIRVLKDGRAIYERFKARRISSKSRSKH